jgi:glycosyltransferase involved in cell wall biosynthesis
LPHDRENLKTVMHTVDTWGPGGAETVCVELAAGLDPSRFRSVASAIREGWVNDALRARGIDTSMTRTGRGPIDVAYLWRIAALARRKRADLIQSHLLTANLYCALASRMLGIPSVATFHGMVDVKANDRLGALKLRLITANVARLVFVSEALRQHFIRAHRVDDRRTVVVPNGIDPAIFRAAPHRALRAELGFADDIIIVGAAGNIRPAKGYDDLIRVAAKLRESCPRLRFVVAGEPGEPLYTSLLELRRQLGVEDRVTFLGFRGDIAAFHNGIDLYVSTSTSEGFSLTTIQAMATALAVVATRSGGPEEIVTDGVDGILVPVGDPDAMARVLAELTAHPERQRALGQAGRETVLRRFTLARMISSYEDLYERALAAR